MSSPDRLEKLGLLQEKKRRAQDLAIRIHTLREDINRATRPHLPIEEMDTRTLGVYLDGLHDARQEHAKLCREIRALCEDLGEKMPDLS
jgi:hypothetical protein